MIDRDRLSLIIRRRARCANIALAVASDLLGRLVSLVDSLLSELYANRTVLVVRTRWGEIVENEDFYEDTARILALESKLRELGIAPVEP